jgi:hypothetical protein
MADFRYYCDEHHLFYGSVRRKDGSLTFGCRRCIEAGRDKNQLKPPNASKLAPQIQQQNERTNHAEEMT